MGWGDARRARIEARQARKEAKFDMKTQRAVARHEATAEMARHGLQRGSVLGDVASQGLSVVRSFGSSSGRDLPTKSGDGGTLEPKSLIPILAGIGGLIYFLKKKK